MSEPRKYATGTAVPAERLPRGVLVGDVFIHDSNGAMNQLADMSRGMPQGATLVEAYEMAAKEMARLPTIAERDNG